MRSDRDRLAEVLEAIERIERHTAAGRATFDTDELVQVWVVRHLQIIGEAAGHLSEDLRARYPDVPWRSITGMRHILVHGYFDVDLDLVWLVVENELDKLKSTISSAMADPTVQGHQPDDRTRTQPVVLDHTWPVSMIALPRVERTCSFIRGDSITTSGITISSGRLTRTRVPADFDQQQSLYTCGGEFSSASSENSAILPFVAFSLNRK